MARFRPILAARDVTEQQWRVIRVLGEESPLDASEAAERASVLAPSLTRIIKALEDRGLITRERNSSDGRRISLAIAPAGLAMIRDVTPETQVVYAQLEARYGHERIEHLLDMLGELADLKGSRWRAHRGHRSRAGATFGYVAVASRVAQRNPCTGS